MRNVQRTNKPKILEDNESDWLKELLDEFAKGTSANKKRIKYLQGKYAHDDIKAALKGMYKFCCYCESRVRNVTVDHIEHRKPKARNKFPESTFEWDNLHLACPNCNWAKGDDWDGQNPILDAVIDSPISDFLSYRGCHRVYLHERGKTTRDHADLNRDELVAAREEILPIIMKLIAVYNTDPAKSDAQIVPKKLEEHSRGQFGSFVRYLTETFLRDGND